MRPSRLTSARRSSVSVTHKSDLAWTRLHPVGAGSSSAPASADELEVVQIASVMRKLRDRLGRDDGYTLVELITVMAILGIVLAPLSSSFASGMVQQASQTRREQAYANARVALQRLRLDIHCASAVTSVEQNAYGGFTLTLTESNDQSPAGWCPAVIPAGAASSGVQWCTVPMRARRRDSTSTDSSGRIPPTATAAAARRSRPATLPRSQAPGRRTRRPSGAQGAVRRRAGSATSGRHR